MAACIVSPAATTANFAILPNGQPVTVTVSNAGGTSTASFSGNAGQRVSLNITNVTITTSKVSILKPGGVALYGPVTVTRTGRFIDVKTLPVTGTYKILVDPKYDYTGKAVLRLYDVPPDPTGTITADGTPVSITTTAPGQNASLTFSGLTGQRVSVHLTSSTYSQAGLKILKPDSTPLYPTALVFGPAGNLLEPQTLPVDGTYTLVIDPTLLAKGSVTVQLYTVPADPTTAGAADGAVRALTTTAPGQNAYLTFTATAGQRVSVAFSGSTYGSVKFSLLKPDASPVFSPSLAISPLGTFAGPYVLVAGTYKVFVDPQLAEVGSVDVKVFDVPADVSGAITPGTPLTVATSAPGQNAVYTFGGTINQRVSLNITNNTYERVAVSILKPDNSALFSPALTVLSTNAFREPTTLPATGTYKLKIDPVDAATGQLDIGLYVVPPDATASIAANGTPVTVSTTAPGQNASLTFAGALNQRVSLRLTGVTMANSAFGGVSVKIQRPDKTTLASLSLGTDGGFIDTKTLPVAGTYKILVDPVLAVTGSMTLTLFTVPADATAAITANGTPVSISTAVPGQNAALTFNGTANQRVFLQVSSISAGTPVPKVALQKVGTTSYVFYPNSVNADPYYFDTKSLGAISGQFKVIFDPQGVNTGGATFKLWTVPADVTTTMTPGGSNTVTLGTPGQAARLTFSATAGQTATITFSSGTINGAEVKLYSTNGTTQLDSNFWDPTVSNSPVQAVLPATGTYTFVLDPVNDLTGSMTFGLTLS